MYVSLRASMSSHVQTLAHTYSGAHCNIRLPSRALSEATDRGQTLATLDFDAADCAEDEYGAVLGASERVPVLLEVVLNENELTLVRGHV